MKLERLSFALLLCQTGLGVAAEPPPAGGPSPETLRAFDTYTRITESRLDSVVQQADGFLWADSPERRTMLRKVNIICEPRNKTGDMAITGGLIHDWVGAVFISGATVAQVLAALQDYDNHKQFYKPDVIDSKLLERNGDDFKIRLRLFKRKVITVILDADSEVHYQHIAGQDWRSRSRSTRIVEIADAGGRHERVRPPGEDHGFLWRLNSYWLFRERDGGAYVECEAVSLSRGIPKVLAPLIRPIIRSLPKDALYNTMRATRERVLSVNEVRGSASLRKLADRTIAYVRAARSEAARGREPDRRLAHPRGRSELACGRERDRTLASARGSDQS